MTTIEVPKLDSYDHAVLIRAKAMALLKKRGHELTIQKNVAL
jgi:hypothetical protein